MQIKFSHNYPKLHDQKTAQLLALKIMNRVEFTPNFIEYDTLFVKDDEGNFGGYYPLPAGMYMVLLFLGNELIPFTTVRRYTDEKHKYYNSSLGKIFDIIIKPEEAAQRSLCIKCAAESCFQRSEIKSCPVTVCAMRTVK